MNRIEQEFDALAEEYESNRLAPWYKAHAEEILLHCNSLGSGDILDVGCGSGYFLRKYLQARPDAYGVGLDLSSKMISNAQQQASRENIENVKFITGDFEDISISNLASDKFRIIVCANAFHYFSDPQTAANKLNQLLESGGTLFVLERDKSQSLLTYVWGFMHRHFIKDHVNFYSSKEIVDFFSRNDFKDVRVTRSIRRFFWKSKIFTSIVLVRCQK